MKMHIANGFGMVLLVLGCSGITVWVTASDAAKNDLLEVAPASRKSDQGLGEILLQGATEASTSDSASESKIQFDLDRLNTDGLRGPPDGLRALHYEYCIPDRPDAVRVVAAIDPTLEIYRGSPGRIGCGADELLCLGHTHQPNHREILEGLAALDMVTEIRECFFE